MLAIIWLQEPKQRNTKCGSSDQTMYTCTMVKKCSGTTAEQLPPSPSPGANHDPGSELLALVQVRCTGCSRGRTKVKTNMVRPEVVGYSKVHFSNALIPTLLHNLDAA